MTATPHLHDLSIIFVLDPPGLTRDSIVLLSSIRHVLGDVKVIAYCPSNKREFLFPYVTEFYDRMGAEIRFMEPTDAFASFYKQGNKILACLEPRDTEYTLFLDTDTAIVAPFDRADLVGAGEVGVVPEGVQGWGGNPGSWEYVYDKFGLPFPEERVRLIRSHKLSLPYWNAGMIAFPTGSGFAESWFRVATELDADPNVVNKRPWLDQIALPLAIAASGLGARELGKEWNLSISHPGHERHHEKFFRNINAVEAKIVHFHQAKFFRGTRFAEVADQAIAANTKFADLAELTAPGDAIAARRAEVWGRFGELKKIKVRSPEEKAEMHLLSQEKNQIKARRTSLDLQLQSAPDSIVKPKVSG
ncbi:hypothetical protein [Falsirhodobacter halotolerans]|uniref:hypothetical protein n=1 Tax=Falsirhodobacter halotolerans TaxID=1146892 RepID=UPI001FD50E78|nr:hypothetical protein [Falsirhodobacter halotolerans]MCJ8138981.1 hypothetical protein [Falsirhodobacter halotolerans]